MASKTLFSQEINFRYGAAMPMSPLVRRFVARNAGPFTFKGTNVYVLGRGEVAVLDPGPDDKAHVEELLAALPGERVTRILLTHTHKDHSGAVRRLQQATKAETYAFYDETAKRGTYRAAGASDGGASLSKGFADTAFCPDRVLEDGDRVQGLGWSLTALHTPGHAPDHVCYALPQEKALFTGDHIMPWSTTVIAPPEGNMSDYMVSLDRLTSRDDQLYYPGHGGRVHNPKRLVKAYVMHRQWREASILEALAAGHQHAESIAPYIYKDLEEALRPAATLSVLAHLEHLLEKGRLCRLEGEGLEASFALD